MESRLSVMTLILCSPVVVSSPGRTHLSPLLPPKPLVALNELEQQHAQGLNLHITQQDTTATDALTREVPPTKHESQGLRGYASHEPKG